MPLPKTKTQPTNQTMKPNSPSFPSSNNYLFLLLFLLVLQCQFSFPLIAQTPTRHTAGCQHFKQQALQDAAAAMDTETLAKVQANNSRSDTIDILNYDIQLDLSDFASGEIAGICQISLVAKLDNVEELLFDLLSLEVSEVLVGEELVSDFEQQGELLRVPLSTPLNTEDAILVTITYAGNPSTATFGGFYTTTTYAYNLGVGIGVDPPSFGRAWFPCFDNFVERSSYTFHIKTLPEHRAFCNGMDMGAEDDPSGEFVTWHWWMDAQIPTYLASVAVSDYAAIEYIHEGANGEVPVTLAARPGDTTNMKNVFVHLPDAIDAFENAWGPHQFNRVGFVAVPFNGGAMEHATNIAFPRFGIVTGDDTWEHLVAHEFGHHWFGDLATCETAGDMWLNEGWASYCENYFTEIVYGQEAYKAEVRARHEGNLQYTPHRDGGHFAISPIPFDITYAYHVYEKGADVAHTLRGYMGDELFFACVADYLQTNQFTHVDSYLFRNHLSDCSGIDLTDFFDKWIFNPGFPHFSIDSLKFEWNGSAYVTDVSVRQRLHHAPEFCINTPLEITFFDFNFNRHTEKMYALGGCTTQSFNVPFYPIYAALDLEEKINDATTDNYQIISEEGVYEFPNTKMTVDVEEVGDSVLLRVVHNWVAPDRFKEPIPNIILSDSRYWTVEGVNVTSFSASAEIIYNGSSSFNGGYLDNTLISAVEQNMVVLYRSTTADDWQIDNFVTQDIGVNGVDRVGTFTLDNLRFGEYTLGIYDGDRIDTLITFIPDCTVVGVGVNNVDKEKINNHLMISPNPATNNLSIKIADEIKTTATEIAVYNYQGQLIYNAKKELIKNVFSVDCSTWQSGVYFVKLYGKNKIKFGEKKVVIMH